MDTIVINLFGAPGSGKSTGAAYIFSKLKLLGIDAELVTEFAKDKVWEDNSEVFKNQLYILGKQSFKMSRCAGKVKVIVTDSPILMSSFYNKTFPKSFEDLVIYLHNSYENLNYFIKRVKPYNPNGRFQTEEEANSLGTSLMVFLTRNNIKYSPIIGMVDGYDTIIDDVITYIKSKNYND